MDELPEVVVTGQRPSPVPAWAWLALLGVLALWMLPARR